VLQRIAKTPNLLQLVRAFGFRAYQYMFLLEYGLVITDGTNLRLTPLSTGYLQRYCTQRFEGGDLVTIVRMQRRGQAGGHWYGYTDSEYRISIYSEDLHAIEKAGYEVPNWYHTAEFQCHIPVIVSNEIQSSGWRIANVEKKQS
jgi:hypothetical protein